MIGTAAAPHCFPWRPHRSALKEQKKSGGGLFGARLLPSSLSPVGTMFHDPIQQGLFKADVFSGFLALDPLMSQDLGTLRKKLLVQHRVLHALRVSLL